MFKVKLCPESQICVTFGTKDAIYNLLRCTTTPGDKVLIAEPSYPMHQSAAMLAGLEVRYFKTQANAKETLESILEAVNSERPKVLLANYPNNPTGQTFSRHEWRQLTEACRAISCTLINDFVYGELHWSDKASGLLGSLSDLTSCIEVYSMSKAYSIPGWRVGAALGCTSTVTKLAKLKSHLDYGLYIPIQLAAAFALSEGNISSKICETYKRRTEIVAQGLEKLGWAVESPEAGCSVWAKCPEEISHEGSLSLASKLMREAAVLLGPGCLYGSQYDDYIRLACVKNDRMLQDVLKRIGDFQSS